MPKLLRRRWLATTQKSEDSAGQSRSHADGDGDDRDDELAIQTLTFLTSIDAHSSHETKVTWVETPSSTTQLLINDADSELAAERHGEAMIGTTILQLALANEVELPHSCGGFGTCGTCRVLIESPLAPLAERNEIEREIAEDRGFAPNERLACQTLAVSTMRVRVP